MISTQTIAFYNLENLFDAHDAEYTLDKNFTPQGIYRWNDRKYRRKIDNLGEVISKIGTGDTDGPPIILGVCEVENKGCLQDLVSCEALRKYQYKFVHFESNDRRGLDTAFLYREAFFNPVNSKAHRMEVPGRSGMEPTRDILHVEGTLFGEHVHALINHWPSRLEGSRITRGKRRAMAKKLDAIVKSIYTHDPNSKILILGDFNDEPTAYSLRNDFTHEFFNVFERSHSSFGTVRFRNKWVVFDQIMMDQNLLANAFINYVTAGVYKPPFLIESNGRHKGSPKRAFRGRFFQNGYSDHLPVYAVLNFHH